MKSSEQIQVQNLDHLGLVAGIIDEIGLVEQINQLVGQHECERVSPGHVVKAIILNGLGFVSAPLYLFSRFFEGKATEHLIGEGVQPEHLNDDHGDVPLFLRVADGNEADKAVFAQVLCDFRNQLTLDTLMVADSALYSAPNLEQMKDLKWLCRVPLTVKSLRVVARMEHPGNNAQRPIF